MVKDLARNAQKAPFNTSLSSASGPSVEEMNLQATAGTSSSSLSLDAAALPRQGPILSLFHNDVITETSIGVDMPEKMSKAEETSCSLRDLLPTREEVDAILIAGTDLWSTWSSYFPEIWNEHQRSDYKQHFWNRVSSNQPVEVAKMLIFLLITIDNIPAIQASLKIKYQRSVVLDHIERLVLHDVEFARTIPGTECMALFAKYLLKIGHLLSSWHLFRRSTDYAIVFGFHKGVAREDALWNVLWTTLCHYDAYLSLILGFPYCVPDLQILKQTRMLLDTEMPYEKSYFLRLTTIMRQIIDRNQTNPNDLPETLKIDENLERLAVQGPNGWWRLEFDPTHSNKMNTDRFMIQLAHHFVRALLFLPFVLQQPLAPRYQLCYDTALTSARSVVASYKVLRESIGLTPYLGIIADFHAFTMATLLVVHVVRQDHVSRQRSSDWDLITTVSDIFRSVASTSTESVASQGLRILEVLLGAQNETNSQAGQGMACKITVPCFGAITIKPRNLCTARASWGDFTDAGAVVPSQPTVEMSQYNVKEQPQRLPVEFENMVALPDADFSWSRGALTSAFEYDLSCDLDHGWELSFLD